MREIKTLCILIFLATSQQVKAYNELTFCHEVRNVRLSITNTGSLQAVAWQWTYTGATPVMPGFRQDSICGGLSYDNPGVYWVYVQTTFSDGSTDLDTWRMNAFVSVIPLFTLPDSVVCTPSISLNYTSGISGPIYRYLWQPSGGTNVSQNITAAGNYTGIVYSVDDYSNRFGACDSQWQDFTITQEAPLNVSLPQGLFICQGAPINLDAGNPGASYAWLPNGETSQVITLDRPGTYSVTVRSPLGCTANASTVVRDSCPIFVWMPNVFSPNGDGRNDRLIWKGNVLEAKNYRYRVYNRWGEKVFDTRDFTAEWDGTYDGKQCQTGVYVYKVEFVDNKDEQRQLEGNVTLIR